MQPSDDDGPATEVAFGALSVTAGLGILTFALFPLALPMVVLTSLLLLPALPFAAIGGLGVALALVVRAVARRLPRRRRPRRDRARAANRVAQAVRPGPAQ